MRDKFMYGLILQIEELFLKPSLNPSQRRETKGVAQLKKGNSTRCLVLSFG
jgi:hypothetical protein